MGREGDVQFEGGVGVEKVAVTGRDVMRKSLSNMVARDGVEPPTPAFSELGYSVFTMTWNARTTP